MAAIKQGNPFDTETMIGAQSSDVQMTKIESYLEIGRQEGAELLAGGARAELGGDFAGGYYIQPTLFKGQNKMRIFQEEIFGPVPSKLQAQHRELFVGLKGAHSSDPHCVRFKIHALVPIMQVATPCALLTDLR